MDHIPVVSLQCRTVRGDSPYFLYHSRFSLARRRLTDSSTHEPHTLSDSCSRCAQSEGDRNAPTLRCSHSRSRKHAQLMSTRIPGESNPSGHRNKEADTNTVVPKPFPSRGRKINLKGHEMTNKVGKQKG